MADQVKTTGQPRRRLRKATLAGLSGSMPKRAPDPPVPATGVTCQWCMRTRLVRVFYARSVGGAGAFGKAKQTVLAANGHICLLDEPLRPMAIRPFICTKNAETPIRYNGHINGQTAQSSRSVAAPDGETP